MKFSLLLALGFGLGTSAVAEAQAEKPNIFIFMTEDMSPRTGFAGDDVAVTPRLDAFAKQGVSFTNVYSVYGVCGPSRSSFVTGRYPFSYGGHNMRPGYFQNMPGGAPYLTVPAPDVKGYPELLRRDGGYYTFANSKCDYQFSENGCSTAPASIWNQVNVNNWRARPEGDARPFMGAVNDVATHESSIFPSSTYPDVLNRTALMEAVTVPDYYADTPTMRGDLARVYNNINIMDSNFGGVLDMLEDDGLMNDTVVIWMSDHGDGLPRSKRDLFDSGTHVPCIIWIPPKFRPSGWADAGTEVDEMVSLIDFAPSILHLAGVPVPEGMQGKSMFNAPDERRGDYIFTAKDRMDEAPDWQRAVRSKEGYKLIRNYLPGQTAEGGLTYRMAQEGMAELKELYETGKLNARQSQWFEPRTPEALYDLNADPYELNNLLENEEGSHAEILAELRAALDAELSSLPNGDMGALPEAEMAERFWPGGVQPITPAPLVDVSASSQSFTLAEQELGSSLMYRLVGCGQDDEWFVYGQDAVTFDGLGCDRVEARAQRYGWSLSTTVSESV
jgi:arylsulfatase A-like enzyme